MTHMIIDPPDRDFAPDDEWQVFLIEMRAAHKKARDIDTAMMIDRYIALAVDVLAERERRK